MSLTPDGILLVSFESQLIFTLCSALYMSYFVDNGGIDHLLLLNFFFKKQSTIFMIYIQPQQHDILLWKTKELDIH